MTTVIINPGHSLNASPDPGAVGNGYKEALVAAEIAKYVSQFLNTKGLDTKIIQQSGNVTANTQLNNLVRDINKTNGNYLVSIHLNSSTSKQATGIETLYYSERGKVLAHNIQEHLVRASNLYNRGIKADTRGLAVLRRTSMPSCLVEVGFISNANDIHSIISNMQTVALAIADGICATLGIKQYSAKQQVQATQKSIKYEIITNEDAKTADLYIDGKIVLKDNKFFTVLTQLNNKLV